MAGVDPLSPRSARLWLDCTIGELATGGGADPNNCTPVPGSDGALGRVARCSSRCRARNRRRRDHPGRGSTPHSVTTTPCRASVDAAGSPSLDAIVNALFDSAQSRLANLNLAGLPAELATLLGAFHLDSTMKVTAGAQPNSYLVDHALVDVSFPGSSNGPTLTAGVLGLPIPDADGITANMSNGGQLQLSPHGFTLRLGTAAQMLLRCDQPEHIRGVADIGHLVAAVFALAELSDEPDIDRLQRTRLCMLQADWSALRLPGQRLHRRALRPGAKTPGYLRQPRRERHRLLSVPGLRTRNRH